MKETYTDLNLVKDSSVIKLNKLVLAFKINKKYFNLFPGKKININNDLTPISECDINVTNITTNYVAIRVRTTKKKYYTVEPTFCTLSPNSTIKITIFIYHLGNEKLSSRGHKFRFEGVVIPDNLLNKDTREIFKELTKSRTEVKGNSLKRIVEFISDEYFDYQKSKTISNNNSAEINASLTPSIYSLASSNLDERLQRRHLASVNEDVIRENESNDENLINKYVQGKNQNKKLNLINKKANEVHNGKKNKDLIPKIKNSKKAILYLIIVLIFAIFLGCVFKRK